MIRPRSTADAYAGYHRYPQCKQQTFQIFYKHRKTKRITEEAGWYWRPTPYDSLIDEETGPFTSSRNAYRNVCNLEK